MKKNNRFDCGTKASSVWLSTSVSLKGKVTGVDFCASCGKKRLGVVVAVLPARDLVRAFRANRVRGLINRVKFRLESGVEL